MIGNFSGFYRGKVLASDVNESLHAGRIKVEVYPMLVGIETARVLKSSDSSIEIDGITTDQLPWAYPATPLFAGAGTGSGTFCVPDIGSTVWIFFENGVIYQPVYFAEAPDAVHGLPSSRETNYPQRRVIRMSSGAEIIFDDSTGDILITGANDVIIQGDTAVRINPL